MTLESTPQPFVDDPHEDTAEVATGRYVVVVFERGQSGVDKELTYAVPDELRAGLHVGSAVLAQVARQTATGYVIGFTDHIDFAPSALKPIVDVLGRAPFFDARALKVARWMSAYYHCSLGECLACYVPHGWQVSLQRWYMAALPPVPDLANLLARSPRQLEIARMLTSTERPLTQRHIERFLGGRGKAAGVGDALKKLVQQGIIQVVEERADPQMKPRRVQAVRLSGAAIAWPEIEKAAPKQAEALRLLTARAGDADAEGVAAWPTALLAREHGFDSAVWRSLEKKGYLEFVQIEQRRAPLTDLLPPLLGRVELTTEQNDAVAAIVELLRVKPQANDAAKDGHGATPTTVLLQGVTASGKTEVYLSAIEECLALGKRALVLVPEIALTAQTVEIFKRRFLDRVAILHSALGSGERFDEWRRVRSGTADIVVGARSAVFAPCRNLGLIVIDEEHDNSYKQDAAPRYHARDVAQRRAAQDGAVLVLGSATPSLESYYKAQRGEYRHVYMKQRIGDRQLPEVELIDMTVEARMGTVPVMSARLKEVLCDTVARGEQAILFLNRRGFATYVQCQSCGHVERCPNCDVTLTYHRNAQLLRCHHCDHYAPVPAECPRCGGSMIGFSGTGTEKVEREVEDLLSQRGLPQARVLRMDRDTTLAKGSHGRILGEFRQGKAQVLIGTQMVTKGLDFPGVTLVGVIAADSALNVPDFRASERTFQLLAQVSGRAGRGEKSGRVLIQAMAVDHPAVTAARDHDYEIFVREELKLRQSPAYPPFAYIVNVISQDEDALIAKARIEALALQLNQAIADAGGGTQLLGPVDCPLAKIKGRFRFHLMLRDRNRPRLHRVLRVYDELPRPMREGLTIDVDPMTIL